MRSARKTPDGTLTATRLVSPMTDRASGTNAPSAGRPVRGADLAARERDRVGARRGRSRRALFPPRLALSAARDRAEAAALRRAQRRGRWAHDQRARGHRRLVRHLHGARDAPGPIAAAADQSFASGRVGSNSSTGLPDGSSSRICLPPTPVDDLVAEMDARLGATPRRSHRGRRPRGRSGSSRRARASFRPASPARRRPPRPARSARDVDRPARASRRSGPDASPRRNRGAGDRTRSPHRRRRRCTCTLTVAMPRHPPPRPCPRDQDWIRPRFARPLVRGLLVAPPWLARRGSCR